MILYLIRHGETDWNLEGRLQGGRDVPLNALGRRQAAEAAARLKALVPDPGGLRYLASPMARARETMAILRGTLGLEPEAYACDERLRELTFGDWEGFTWREVRTRDPDRARARERDKWGYVPPNGESYAMLGERIAPVLADLAEDTVVVSHGGIARAALRLLCGVGRAEAPLVDIWQGRILVIEGGAYRWV